MKHVFSLLGLSVLALSAQAVQIVLPPAAVIGSSGSAGTGFAGNHVLDQQTGPITDVSRATYWVSQSTGTTNPFLTIDLGAFYTLDALTLYNTHNDQWYDYGTGNFLIVGGSAVADLGGGNFRLTGTTTTLLTGTLVADTMATPTAQNFASLVQTPVRYIEFVPLSVASRNRPAGPTAFGLNEIRVFATAVPEPPTVVLAVLGAVVLIGSFRMQRRRRET